jgi:nicotinate-nucleotide adenylyltransferase
VSSVGILGGTFNPPHVGHIACARAALDGLELDRVLLMPVSSPPHKPMHDEPGPEHRLALCRLAAEGERGFGVSALEIERGGSSYTVDTLRGLHATCPEDELTWIAGGDMATSLPSWKEPEEVLSLARFAVAEREGSERERIEQALGPLRGRDRVVLFHMPRIDVSSSMVRARVAAGQPIDDLVPDAVARYIGEHGLYRSPVAAG